ncbi:hypothetical protein EVAR_68085_1 [Eumeta japonica]|uniref:Uncharacterized protein n=1 Tax=Eumeta variegata TaxID=151549 RepID=A0A4C1ZLI7_EUMVA|nr:hypothetical protein EVAR_68085_1 [Eumeta japonica]
MDSKRFSRPARLAIHNGVLIRALTYGNESCVWQKHNESGINGVEMQTLRSMCGVSRKDTFESNNDPYMFKVHLGWQSRLSAGRFSIRHFGTVTRHFAARIARRTARVRSARCLINFKLGENLLYARWRHGGDAHATAAPMRR